MLEDAPADSFVKGLFRGWTRTLGPTQRLRLASAGAAVSEALLNWAQDMGVAIQTAPGEAHHRLGADERRRRALRHALESLLRENERFPPDREGVKWALGYVLPAMSQFSAARGSPLLSGVFGKTAGALTSPMQDTFDAGVQERAATGEQLEHQMH